MKTDYIVKFLKTLNKYSHLNVCI